MKKNIIVLGKNSFVASHISYNKIEERLPSNKQEISKILSKYNPDVIINCIGFCGNPNIDQCEIEKEKTIESNLTIPIMLGEICNKENIQLIHIGSGCIFYGHSRNTKVSLEHGPVDIGWKEQDAPKLQHASFYSRTKYSADLMLESLGATILRIRMPISGMASSRNLLSKITKYKQVLEEPNSATFLKDLVNGIDWVIDNNKTGVYHFCSQEPITHSMLLEEYKKYVPSHTYKSITKEELSEITAAPRSNCILNSDKIVSEGFKFMDQNDCIKECIKSFVQNSRNK